MADWFEVTNILMQDEKIMAEFLNSQCCLDAFEEWASLEYPEEYGND